MTTLSPPGGAAPKGVQPSRRARLAATFCSPTYSDVPTLKGSIDQGKKRTIRRATFQGLIPTLPSLAPQWLSMFCLTAIERSFGPVRPSSFQSFSALRMGPWNRLLFVSRAETLFSGFVGFFFSDMLNLPVGGGRAPVMVSHSLVLRLAPR